MTAPRVRILLSDPEVEVSLAPGEAVRLVGNVGRVTDVLAGAGPGEAAIDGTRLRNGVARRVRAGLGLIPSSTPVAADVSVLDHLAARVSVSRARELVERAPLLAGRGGDPAGVLSGGERTVLAWLRCLATAPRAVLLERAGAGLDADTFAWASDRIVRWRDDGVVVMVVPGRAEEDGWADRDVTIAG